jgi:tripartite-type tricarboxylate transporter receptor subunit TctC
MLCAISCAAKRLQAISLMLVAMLGTAVTASAEFPERPLTLIVPFAAGGPTDALARVLGQRMSEELKQQVVVENVGGASSILGSARASKAAPDGYTILINDLALPSASALKSNLPFDVRADFVALGLINGGPMVLIGRKSLQADTAQQLFAKIRTEKDNIKLGHGGTGTNSHMCGLLIQRALGVTVTAVSYRGTGPAMNDLIGGTLDIICDQSSTAIPQIQAGNVVAHGVTSATRVSAIPDVPTLAEAGLAGFDFVIWHGLYAPNGTPDAIVQILNRALNVSLDDPAIRKRYAEMGRTEFTTDQRTPAAHKARLNAEIERLRKLLQDAGTTPGQ